MDRDFLFSPNLPMVDSMRENEQIRIEEVNFSNELHAIHLVEMLNSYAMDLMGGGEPLSPFVRKNLAIELGKRSGCVALLAYDEERPCGFLVALEGFSTFACMPLMNLHDIAVLPEYRGRGISKQLMSRIESIARQRGCCKLTLEVLSGNHVAMAAYRKLGFEGYQLDPDKGTALFWQKKL